MGAIDSFFQDSQSVFDRADLPVDISTGRPYVRCGNRRSLPVDLGVTPGSFSVELSHSEYHSFSDVLSHSGAIELERSAAHYLAYLTQIRAPRTEPNIGTAIHDAWLLPAVYRDRYVTWGGGRRQGRRWEEFREQHAGKTVLSEAERLQVEGMLDALNSFKELPLADVRALGETEKSIFWVDQETGVPCRIRVDLLTPAMAFDLKSYDDVRPSAFYPQAIRKGYDVQAAMYQEGIAAYLGRKLPFCFVAVEDARPHGVWLYPASEDFIERGRRQFRRALQNYARIRETGEYSGYEGAITPIELSRWDARKLEEGCA
ncbi:MAG: hypothetical protein E6Q40_15655 [Cupriavidus sp.]|nr:MAG: hypothetical protein E6Q40_15655 [Cupriavidus sp.]